MLKSNEEDLDCDMQQVEWPLGIKLEVNGVEASPQSLKQMYLVKK